jgi:hypothetical protein
MVILCVVLERTFWMAKIEPWSAFHEEKQMSGTAQRSSPAPPIINSPSVMSTTVSPLASPSQGEEPTNACCLHPVSMEELTKTYSADFFEDRVDLYQKWLDVAPTINGSLCHDQWTRLILQEDHGGHYFDLPLTNLRENQTNTTRFPFSTEALNPAPCSWETRYLVECGHNSYHCIRIVACILRVRRPIVMALNNIEDGIG